ncbi:MAG: HNH endonuclease [Armatimonadetes bacterium]|nr:HNH endonuclease [Armatimonadota bacterium]
MPTYSEPELVIPALGAIRDNPGISTSELINVLTDQLTPTGHNGEIIQGRADTYFSQKVRNLKSHNTLEGPGWVTYDEGNWSITPAGVAYLQSQGEIETALEAQGFSCEEVSGPLEDLIIEEGAETVQSVTVRQRSLRLRDAAIETFRETHNGKLYCSVCAFDFEEEYGEQGRGFIEMHHTRPLTKGQTTRSQLSQLLRDNVIVPLCSNCHRMIHRYQANVLTIEGLRETLDR